MKGAYRDRHDTRGGMRWLDGIARRAMSIRDAKACGPGTPGLVLSSRVNDPANDGDYEVMDTGESAP